MLDLNKYNPTLQWADPKTHPEKFDEYAEELLHLREEFCSDLKSELIDILKPNPTDDKMMLKLDILIDIALDKSSYYYDDAYWCALELLALLK